MEIVVSFFSPDQLQDVNIRCRTCGGRGVLEDSPGELGEPRAKSVEHDKRLLLFQEARFQAPTRRWRAGLELGKSKAEGPHQERAVQSESRES